MYNLPSGHVTLQISSLYTGVINVSTFQFVINVFNESSLFTTLSITPVSFNGASSNISITISLSTGIYYFTAISSNTFGQSLNSTTFNVTIGKYLQLCSHVI